MLILNRKVGESIWINDDVEIKVLAMKGGQIRLGIEAPKTIIVHRDEVFQRIHQTSQRELPKKNKREAD